MKTSQALRLTKLKLWNGLGDMPPGVSSTEMWAAFRAGTCEQVVPLFNNLLVGHESLHSWLRARGYDISDTAKLQATRHAWLDHLIFQYEALND